MTIEKTLADLARTFADAFESAKRDNGETFYKLKDGSPQWMTDAIREAHAIGGDTILPNDWVYSACDTMISHMADSDPEQWDEYSHEWADGAVDCYNTDRAQWAASHLRFGCAVDEARDELGDAGGFYEQIGYGQYHVLRNIAGTLIKAVRAQAEDADDESDDDA